MFATELVLRAIREGRCDRALDVINWFSGYFDTEVYEDWLDVNGGWVGEADKIVVLFARETYIRISVAEG